MTELCKTNSESQTDWCDISHLDFKAIDSELEKIKKLKLKIEQRKLKCDI